jgi:uncharacterized membrane protein
MRISAVNYVCFMIASFLSACHMFVARHALLLSAAMALHHTIAYQHVRGSDALQWH